MGAAGRLDKKERLKRFKNELDDDDELPPESARSAPNILDFTASYTEAATKDIINDLREKFAGHVIRRTGASKDNNGKPLAGIAPAREHILSLELFAHEYEYIDAMTEEFRNEDGSLVKMTSVVSVPFLLRLRSCAASSVC